MFWVDRGQSSCVLLTSLHHLQMSLSLWVSCWYALQSSVRTVAHGTSDNGRAFLLFFRQGTSMHCPKVLSCLSRCLWCQVLADTTNWHSILLLTSAWESNFTGKIRSIEGTEKSTSILQRGRLSISYQAWSMSLEFCTNTNANVLDSSSHILIDSACLCSFGCVIMQMFYRWGLASRQTARLHTTRHGALFHTPGGHAEA